MCLGQLVVRVRTGVRLKLALYRAIHQGKVEANAVQQMQHSYWDLTGSGEPELLH